MRPKLPKQPPINMSEYFTKSSVASGHVGLLQTFLRRPSCADADHHAAIGRKFDPFAASLEERPPPPLESEQASGFRELTGAIA